MRVQFQTALHGQMALAKMVNQPLKHSQPLAGLPSGPPPKDGMFFRSLRFFSECLKRLRGAERVKTRLKNLHRIKVDAKHLMKPAKSRRGYSVMDAQRIIIEKHQAVNVFFRKPDKKLLQKLLVFRMKDVKEPVQFK